MIIYIKNDRGVALPLYMKPHDSVEEIWKELRVCSSINDRSLEGKILTHGDRELCPNDRLDVLGINAFSVILLRRKEKDISESGEK